MRKRIPAEAVCVSNLRNSGSDRVQLMRVAHLAAAWVAVGDFKPLRHQPRLCLSDGHCPQACRSRRFIDIIVKAECRHCPAPVVRIGKMRPRLVWYIKDK